MLPCILIRLSLRGTITSRFEAIIDTGSAICIFDAQVAEALGIVDIKSGEAASVGSIAKGTDLQVYAHEVKLHVESQSAPIMGFFSKEIPICILGRNGFLDTYSVSFGPFIEGSGFHCKKL